MQRELSNDVSFDRFEEIQKELGKNKIEDLSMRDIAKYLLVSEELMQVDCNIGDDKVFCSYNEQKLEDLSYIMEDSIFRLLNEEILYDYDLHTEPNIDDLEM